jgi:N-succinyldiaminopimelate aminotransferase
MNPRLASLHPYPFEKLRVLFKGIIPPEMLRAINLSIGEPKHSAPHLITAALEKNIAGVSQYPTTKGILSLRETIANWLTHRFKLPETMIDAERHILPVNGTREALFAIAQTLIDSSKKNATVLMPNPFYQIYEGAALLAGATPVYLTAGADTNFFPDFFAVSDDIWQDCQLLYVCSPANPQGSIIDRNTWQHLLTKSDEHGFVIASDECYSELYQDEKNPPIGLLQVCAEQGRIDMKNCLVFHSLSKRSNVPGMRSGFVAGDAALIEPFLLYRTYHGSAMPLQIQYASIAAWSDEKHVKDNRAIYRTKFSAIADILKDTIVNLRIPPASFYLWLPTPTQDDVAFAKHLLAYHHIMVLPGSLLSREVDGKNPAAGYIRVALVAPLTECIEAAKRIREAYREYEQH